MSAITSNPMEHPFYRGEVKPPEAPSSSAPSASEAERELLAKKREANIALKAAERTKRAEELKQAKAEKAAARGQAELLKRQESETRRRELAEKEAKRAEAIAAKEAARREREQAKAAARAASGESGCKYAKTDILTLKKVFDDYDRDGGGEIDIFEFKEALKKRQEKLVSYDGRTKTRAERKAAEGVSLLEVMEPLFEAMDRDGDGSATFGELLHVLYPLANQKDREIMMGWVAEPPPPPPQPKVILNQEQLDEIREIFNLYDRDRSGTLTVDELSKALSSCGMEPEEIEELFGQSDDNADGVVSFDEFAKLMGSTGLFDLTG